MTIFACTTGEGSVLLCDYFAFTTGEGNVSLRGCFACTTGEGNVLLRDCLREPRVKAACYCVTIIEDITCCEILFMRNELEF